MTAKPGITTTVAVSLILMLFNQGVASLPRIIDLIVPPFPERNKNVTLECKYDTGTKQLYAIKWFHNDLEFYRYLPKEEHPTTIFENPNIKVIKNGSQPTKLVLKEVDLSAAGQYRCEVHLDWPEFETDNLSKNMTVVVIPEEQPNIEGDVAGHYSVGNWVNLTCTAAPSIPPAALVWLINDKEATDYYLINYDTHKKDDGLMVSNLGLNFKLSKTDFINGELKLKCTATIATLYHSSDEHSQQEPSGPVKEVRERPSEGSLVTTASNSGHNTIWGSSASQQRLFGFPLMVALLCVTLLW